MATFDHPSFQQPENRHIPVWRYMDITKLIWVLQQKSLYFAKTSELGDPFEGHYTRAFKDSRETFIEYMLKNEDGALNFSAEKFREVMGNNHDAMLGSVLNMKNQFHVSCWHMNDQESSAMWKLYTSMNEAVCIKSTYQKLRNSLPSDVFLGVVKYINYETGLIDFGNVLNYMMHKRESFSHEKEVRALIWDVAGESALHTDRRLPGGGLKVAINLQELIQGIYISPSAQRPLLEVVTQLVKEHALNVPVLQSEVNAAPAY